MQYLNPKAIKNDELANNRNQEFVGPAVRHGFSIEITEKYSKLIFKRERERERVKGS